MGAWCLVAAVLVALACLPSPGFAQDEDFPTLYNDWEAKVEAAVTTKNYSFSRWEIYSPSHDRVSDPPAQTPFAFFSSPLSFLVTCSFLPDH